jgi:hypothetical protein
MKGEIEDGEAAKEEQGSLGGRVETQRSETTSWVGEWSEHPLLLC